MSHVAPALCDVDRKVVATMQARAALAGFTLAPLPDGAFLIARWDLSRELEHIAAVEAFLARVQGRSG